MARSTWTSTSTSTSTWTSTSTSTSTSPSPSILQVLACVAVGLLGCAQPQLERERLASTSSAITGGLSVTSGVNGTVTTLAYYSGSGTAHPGTNAVDIGAGGGSTVWHQLDYLPPNVAGGWIRTYATHDAGYCSQWYPGSPYYNGSKVIVVVYFYATDGTYLGWHRSAYQHVEPTASSADGWWKWNNPAASPRAWGNAGADVDLGGGGANGLHIGSVFGVPSPIYNGPGGGLCTDGSHLHQEADGARVSSLFVGKGLTERYNDVQLFGIAGGQPSTGAPPSLPTLDPPPPPDPQPDPDPPADPDPADPPADPSKADPPKSGGEGQATPESDRQRAREEKPKKPTPQPAVPDGDDHPSTLGATLPNEEVASAGCSITRTQQHQRQNDYGSLVAMLVGVAGAVAAIRRRRRRQGSPSH
jgi:hypothetical protein